MSGEWDRREEHHKQNTGLVATMPKPANKWRAMERYLTKRKLSFPLARDNGWYPSVAAGDNELRVVIPATNSLNTPFWQARLIRSGDSDLVGKRWQSPHADRHDSIVIVWNYWGDRETPIIVVEGPMCALAAADLGYTGVALMGATPPLACFDLISKFTQNRAIVIADTDAVERASLWVAQLNSRGIRTDLGLPNGGKDLAGMTPKRRKQLLEMWEDAT